MTALLERPVVPTPADAQLAREASRILSMRTEAPLHVQLDDGTVLALPKAVSDLLYHVLKAMGQGDAVTLIPIHAELTTQEAADYMNVSRPYLINLLKEGKLPFHMVGTHRRIKFKDLDTFCKAAEHERKRVMEELAAQAQDLGMGY